MKKQLLLINLCIIGSSFVMAQDLPDNRQSDKCYVKCVSKDEFKEVTETIQTSPEYTVLEVIPATYKTVEERVVVKEASKKFVYVPAVYETIEVPYEREGRKTQLKVTPASFRNASKAIEVYPKTSGWEYAVMEDCVSLNKEDCLAALFVERPARFEEVKLKELVSDASFDEVPLTKEKIRTYKKRVVKIPARMDEIVIPAEYTTIKKQVVDQPATTKKRTMPAETSTVTKSALVKKGGITTWEEVDCNLLNPNVLPIFYDLGSARLTTASKKIIDDTLLPIMKDSKVSVEIMSHTDSRGNDTFNQSLSQKRANSVVNYLVSKGISKSRLSSRGYGETRLTNKCSNNVDCSEAEHQNNRRTEFRVVNN